MFWIISLVAVLKAVIIWEIIVTVSVNWLTAVWALSTLTGLLGSALADPMAAFKFW